MRFHIVALIVGSLILTACGVEGDIEDALEAGQCRKAEQLVIDEYSGQLEVYKRAMIYINCGKNKSKGVRLLKKLADADYIPALERLIEYDVATKRQHKRYTELKAAAAQRAYERRQRQKERLLNYGKRTTRTTSAPKQLDNNKCIQDGGTLMCYNRQSQRYGNY